MKLVESVKFPPPPLQKKRQGWNYRQEGIALTMWAGWSKRRRSPGSTWPRSRLSQGCSQENWSTEENCLPHHYKYTRIPVDFFNRLVATVSLSIGFQMFPAQLDFRFCSSEKQLENNFWTAFHFYFCYKDTHLFVKAWSLYSCGISIPSSWAMTDRPKRWRSQPGKKENVLFFFNISRYKLT